MATCDITRLVGAGRFRLLSGPANGALCARSKCP
jgi:hypothetical protein